MARHAKSAASLRLDGDEAEVIDDQDVGSEVALQSLGTGPVGAATGEVLPGGESVAPPAPTLPAEPGSGPSASE